MPDAAIKRDPALYQHVFDTAESIALHLQLEHNNISDEEFFCIYLYAIQQAINTELRPEQTQAEGNMKQLTQETLKQ